jgi:signal transduction histidine kinase
VTRDDFLSWADVLPEPTLLVAADGNVLAANRAVEREFGFPRAVLTDRKLGEVATDPPERLVGYLRLCARSRDLVPGALTLSAGGRALACRCEGAVVRPADAARPAVLVLRLRSKESAVEQFLALSVKVEQLAREVARRQQSEEAFRELDRRKNEFLDTLAHELRNPLTPITNSLEILRMPGLPPERDAHFRAVIARQVGELARLIGDMLEVARLVRDRIELRKERVELGTVVDRGVETARPLIDARGHQLTVTLPPGPVWLVADLARLGQVIANLLSNAAKFTDEGGRITLEAVSELAHVVVRVSDTGIGIPADALARVFEPFVHQELVPGRYVGGLGIGLTLVKRHVEMHGGTVEATSPGPGQGSTFTVRLPVAAGEQETSAP